MKRKTDLATFTFRMPISMEEKIIEIARRTNRFKGEVIVMLLEYALAHAEIDVK